MTSSTETAVTTQTYRIWIKATPEAIWQALTDPDVISRYGYGGQIELEPRPGGAFRAAYGLRGAGAYLVRPDGHVGFRCSPVSVSALEEHLARIFG